jgi:hypothetical protein
MGNEWGLQSAEFGLRSAEFGAARASTANAIRMPHVRRERNRVRVGAVSCFGDSD